MLGAIIASIAFSFVNLLITTADLRTWYYYNDHVVRNTDKIISAMEIVGGINAVSYRAVKTYKLIRPEYKIQEIHENGSDTGMTPISSVLIPVLSAHGPEFGPESLAHFNSNNSLTYPSIASHKKSLGNKKISPKVYPSTLGNVGSAKFAVMSASNSGNLSTSTKVGLSESKDFVK